MARQPEIYMKFAAVLSIMPDMENGMLTARLRGIDGRVYCLDLPEPIVGPLIIGLATQAAHLTSSGATQPMNLTSGKLFTLDDGRAGLELLLENTVRLPLVFPPESIPVLRNVLDELEDLNKKAPPKPKPH